MYSYNTTRSVSVRAQSSNDRSVNPSAQIPDAETIDKVSATLAEGSGSVNPVDPKNNSDRKRHRATRDRRDKTGGLKAAFDEGAKDIQFNNVPRVIYEYLVGKRNFNSEFLPSRNISMNVVISFVPNTIIYMATQLYRWFRENSNSYKVDKSIILNRKFETLAEREGIIKNEILYSLVYHVTYILYVFKEEGYTITDEFIKEFRGTRTVVGVLTLLRLCNTYMFSFSLGEFGSLTIKITTHCLDYISKMYDGKIYNEIAGDKNVARVNFRAYTQQLELVYDIVQIPTHPISEELKYMNALGCICELLTFKDLKTGKPFIISFIPNHNDLKRAAFSSLFDIRLQGQTPNSRMDTDLEPEYSDYLIDIQDEPEYNGSNLFDLDQNRIVDIGTEIAYNIGKRYPLKGLDQLGPFEVYYFFGKDYLNATSGFSFSGDGTDMDSGIKVEGGPSPSGSGENIIDSAKRQIGDFAQDVANYGSDFVKQQVIPTLLLSAAGFIPGGNIVSRVAANAARSSRAGRNASRGLHISSHPLK